VVVATPWFGVFSYFSGIIQTTKAKPVQLTFSPSRRGPSPTMKKKTVKRTLWIVALALAVLLALTVPSELSYEIEGPWGTSVVKNPVGLRQISMGAVSQYFRVEVPHLAVGYMVNPEGSFWGNPGPNGFSWKGSSIDFRFRSYLLYVTRIK
jgi:hypothetical protein